MPPPAHILLVEDSTLVAAALRILLEDAGHRVTAVGTVNEAMACLGADPPDVMLLDLSLPDGDGLSVLARAAGSPAPPRVTVAITGHDDPAIRDRCLRAGCRDVLVKPIAAAQLPGQIRSWLEGGESRSMAKHEV
ncbi:MAG: response regulator [Gemmatimonadota bacterium]|nr:response regulator [Gemmatimonadota bacterium]